MNHTQTAQQAMAAHAQGQVPEVQGQQTIKIGFEQALIMFNPEWRTVLTPEQVNQFRHFYHRGHVDTGFLIQMSNQTMQQNLDAVMNTVIVTGNEEQIAAAQREAQQAALQTDQAAALSTSQIAALSASQLSALPAEGVTTKARKTAKPPKPTVKASKKVPVKAAAKPAPKKAGKTGKK
jgi:hypothetical protein